jgi:hypothetical protein
MRKKININTKKLTMQKKIRYKVVKKRTRYGCTIHGSSLYALKYTTKTMVFARPETIGVICFDTLDNAERFITRYHLYDDTCKIVEVLPIGRGRRNPILYSTRHLNYLYNGGLDESYEMVPPRGTVCYPGVYVTE